MMEMGVPEAQGPQVSRCPVCTEVVRLLVSHKCDSCNGVLHQSCRDWIGGCSTYACRNVGSLGRRQAEYLYHCIGLRVSLRGQEFLVACAVILAAGAQGRLALSLTWLVLGFGAATRYMKARRAQSEINPQSWTSNVALGTIAPWFIHPRRIAPDRGLIRALGAHFVGYPVFLLDVLIIPLLLLSPLPEEAAAITLSLIWFAYRSSFWRYSPATDRLDALAAVWTEGELAEGPGDVRLKKLS